MKEIIEWLIKIERMANEMYHDATEVFKDDKPFAQFLKHAAEDEAWHYHTMQSAAAHIRENIPEPAGIILCSATKERIEAPFRDGLQLLSEGTLTKEQLITIIIESEFSEWNEIFLYVINSLRASNRMFEYVASRMQQHLKYIHHFVESLEYGSEKLAAFVDIPPVWEERILIVDDDEAILQLLSSLFMQNLQTETASNGREALEMIKKNHFDLIISDIDMPDMNGIELYSEAAKSLDDLSKKFIFHSGNFSGEHDIFCKEHSIERIEKPSSITHIQESVSSKLKALREE